MQFKWKYLTLAAFLFQAPLALAQNSGQNSAPICTDYYESIPWPCFGPYDYSIGGTGQQNCGTRDVFIDESLVRAQCTDPDGDDFTVLGGSRFITMYNRWTDIVYETFTVVDSHGNSATVNVEMIPY